MILNAEVTKADNQIENADRKKEEPVPVYPPTFHTSHEPKVGAVLNKI